jgi:putative ABC transport system permease protein
VTPSVAERVYRVLLWLHPPAFRRSFGDEILQHVRTEARRTPSRTLVPALIRDGVASLAREWTARRRPGHFDDLRPGESMQNTLQDLKLAARMLLRTPAFTAAAIVTLALGIGANTAMFTLADATLLRPIPVRDPQQLVVWSWSSSWPHYQEYARRTDIFAGVLASGGTMRLNLATDGSSELVQGALYSGNAFEVLGIGAAVGRTLLPSDDVGGGPIVAVLSHGYWRSRFGGEPSVVGRAVRINGRPATIVGVAERGFRGTTLSMNPDLYIPAAVSGPLSTGFFSRVDRLKHTGFVWLTVIGRLRPDVTAVQASGAMDALYTQLQPPAPGTTRDETLRLEPLETRALGSGAADVRTFINLLLGVVALTLLIGCANLANLLLAKSVARRREMGVRLALGATRARVIHQVLVESVLLAFIGGAAGLVVATLALRALRTFELPGGLRIANIPLELSGTALAATFGLSLLTGLLFGAAPAWRAARADVLVSLRDQSRGATSRSGVRSLLLAAQVAMSLVLLIGTGLFARSLMTALDTRLGFETQGVTTATVNLGLARYDAARARTFYETALERVRALPQVTHAAWANLVPTRGAFMWNTEVEGTRKSLTVHNSHVGPDYFASVGTRLVAGRTFQVTDTAAAQPVAIVNETMAREYFGARGALGNRIKMFDTWINIVGIAENTIVEELREKPAAQVYLAFDQWLDGPRGIATDTAYLFIKGPDDAAVLPLVREQLRGLDPELPLYDIVPFEQRIAGLAMPQRMGVTLFTLFSAIAVALSVVGIYGVATYVATLRTREFGVRLALGAPRPAIRRLVLVQGARPVVGGIIAGLLLALYAARSARAFLVDVSPMDPLTFAAVPVILAAVALAASYIPARRASRIEPIRALREE